MKVKEENQVSISNRFVVWDNLYGNGEIKRTRSIRDNTQIPVVFKYNPL